jgi:hypothetical protein
MEATTGPSNLSENDLLTDPNVIQEENKRPDLVEEPADVECDENENVWV